MRRTSVQLAVAVLVLTGCSAAGASRLLYEKQSPYNHVLVTENAEGLRSLQFERDGALQSQGRPTPVQR